MGKKLVFMHLPKTGGSSLHEILEARVGKGLTCPVRHNLLDRLSPAEKRAYQLFSGHYYYDAIVEHLQFPKNIITLFREPCARLLSAYYFGRSHTCAYIDQHPEYSLKPDCYAFHGMSYRAAKEADLASYLRSEGKYLSNMMTRWIAGAEGTDQARLSRAKTRIEIMDAIGIMENMDESVKLILQATGLEQVDSVPQVKAFDRLVEDSPHAMESIEREAVSPEIASLLDEITQLDRELYDFARALFESRL